MDELEVKLSETQINRISKDSKVKVNLPSGEVYIMRPITANEYYEYLTIKDNSPEIEANAFIISSALVEPEMTPEEARELPIGEFKLLYGYSMKISFLTPMDLDG